MSDTHPTETEMLALVSECPRCGAAPLQPCLRENGRATKTHMVRTGAVPTKANRYMPLDQRLFLLVEKSHGCWQWKGHTCPEGYGRIRYQGRRLLAHRVSYEIAKGCVPDGLVLDHLCRNRACVNPDHLEPVTDRINMIRGESIAAKNARKTHCVHDHEFTPENTRYTDDGLHRVCRTCRREAARRQRAARIARRAA